jgi:hypothetical protein
MKNAFDILKKTFHELWLKSSFHHLFLDVVICCCMLHNLILNWRDVDMDMLILQLE